MLISSLNWLFKSAIKISYLYYAFESVISSKLVTVISHLNWILDLIFWERLDYTSLYIPLKSTFIVGFWWLTGRILLDVDKVNLVTRQLFWNNLNTLSSSRKIHKLWPGGPLKSFCTKDIVQGSYYTNSTCLYSPIAKPNMSDNQNKD